MVTPSRASRSTAGDRRTRGLASRDTRTWILGQAHGVVRHADLYRGIRGDRCIAPRLGWIDPRSCMVGRADLYRGTRGDRSIQVRTCIEGQALGADRRAGIDRSIPTLPSIQVRSGRRAMRGSIDPSARIGRSICAWPTTPSVEESPRALSSRLDRPDVLARKDEELLAVGLEQLERSIHVFLGVAAGHVHAQALLALFSRPGR